MATKIKGIYKGFKHISQIFVVKDHGEMEIGYPTDVKHLAHIGLDGPSDAAPSWMNGFKNGPKFSATSDGGEQRDSNLTSHSPWSSQSDDSELSIGAVVVKDIPPKPPRVVPISRENSSQVRLPSPSNSKPSRAAKSKLDYCASPLRGV